MYEYETNKLKSYLGNNLYDTLRKYNVFIAGGAVTSIFTRLEINDIDIYFRDKDSLSLFLRKEVEGNWITCHTDKAFSFRYDDSKLQCIYFKFFESPEEIFNTFDFTVCMGAFDFKTENFILHENFLKHNSQRILMFNKDTAFPIISALRIGKYNKKGYYISKAEFLKVMLTVSLCKISSYKELKEQIGGMYGENYDNILSPENEEDFNIVDVVERLSNIMEDPQINIPNDEEEIYNWDIFVEKTLGNKIKYFEYDGHIKGIVGSDFIDVSSSDLEQNPELFELCDVQTAVQFPIKRYKYVKNVDDKYYSFFDKNFEYKIGEFCADNSKCRKEE